jgi:hypothetical protein
MEKRRENTIYKRVSFIRLSFVKAWLRLKKGEYTDNPGNYVRSGRSDNGFRVSMA